MRLPPAEKGFDPPPAETRRELERLIAALDGAIPPKVVDRNLLIATWNVKHLARYTDRWTYRPDDDPKRNLSDVCAIAEIVSRFDVVALVEVKRDLSALRLLMKILGPEWAFTVSDVTEGEPGNAERLAYVYDLRRVRPSGMVGELVIPDDVLDDPQSVIHEQFARTPYTVSFRAGPEAFTLVTLHVKWKSEAERTPELKTIADWLARRSKDRDEFNRNLIALGDFNIERRDDPNWKAFVQENGLQPPEELDTVLRTVGETEMDHTYYDQIAWFRNGRRSALTLDYVDAGGFIWTDHLLTDVADVDQKQARISDHFPLWAMFALRDAPLEPPKKPGARLFRRREAVAGR
jgi:endonuclease/exonuclease/phosphatase family metal-dependent hydrolase